MHPLVDRVNLGRLRVGMDDGPAVDVVAPKESTSEDLALSQDSGI